ncbi:MAG: uL22 family ribosomal protein [Nanoarchaeota archaeon]|nr:uL22 family ribosomal protein [Nanoarchaeota archaeon]
MEKQYSPSQTDTKRSRLSREKIQPEGSSGSLKKEKKVVKKLPHQIAESNKITETKKVDEQKTGEKKEIGEKEIGEQKIGEQKTQDKTEKKVEKRKEIIKKEFAIVNGRSLRISYKYAGEVCRMIKGKTPSQAIERIDAVLKFKRAVPMQRREAAHQKGAGISGGKFPINVCIAMKDLLKQLQANANYNGVENPVIIIAKSNKASMPFRKAGTRGKRAHVYIEVRDKTKIEGKEK